MMQPRPLAAVLIAAVLTGCMNVGPDYKRPQVETPDQWPGETTTVAVSSIWWRAYGDPALDQMIDEALVHNLDLRQAIARVNEARAVLGIARADQYPGVSANASASRNRFSQDSVLSVPPGTDPEYSNYRATIGASYEIDFWGKYRRATEAARANLLNSQFNREAVRLALIADVAKSYFSLRSLDAQVAITRRTISTRQASTALQRMRFEAGIASELDLRQVEAEAAQAQALLPAIELLLAATGNRAGRAAWTQPARNCRTADRAGRCARRIDRAPCRTFRFAIRNAGAPSGFAPGRTEPGCGQCAHRPGQSRVLPVDIAYRHFSVAKAQHCPICSTRRRVPGNLPARLRKQCLMPVVSVRRSVSRRHVNSRRWRNISRQSRTPSRTPWTPWSRSEKHGKPWKRNNFASTRCKVR